MQLQVVSAFEKAENTNAINIEVLLENTNTIHNGGELIWMMMIHFKTRMKFHSCQR